MSNVLQSEDDLGPLVPPNPPSSNRNLKMPNVPIKNNPSLLLSDEENHIIFEVLEAGQNTLSTAVVQLLLPSSDEKNWQIQETGAVCFIRDQTKKTYFIQVFSFHTKRMLFHQEIYREFEYRMPVSVFLTFEGDTSMVGLNFADATEATNFRDVLSSKLDVKRQRRNARKSRLMGPMQDNNRLLSPDMGHQKGNEGKQCSSSTNFNNISNDEATDIRMPLTSNSGNMGFDNNRGGETIKWGGADKYSYKGKGKLRKEDIGTPTNFRHIQHVGWDAQRKGYDLDNVDNDLQAFFKKVGVSENQLKDKNTRKFIYDFIETHGGVEAVKHEISGQSSGSLLEPNPTGIIGNRGSSPSPSLSPSLPVRPPPPVRNSGSSSSLNKAGGPPPPPPPPPMSAGGIPPPPPLIPLASIGGDKTDSGFSEPKTGSANRGIGPALVADPQSALLEQIRGGFKLKSVTEDRIMTKKAPTSIADCLSQITSGVGLKPVGDNPRSQAGAPKMEGLVGALFQALADRNRVIQSSESEGTDDEDVDMDEDEWD